MFKKIGLVCQYSSTFGYEEVVTRHQNGDSVFMCVDGPGGSNGLIYVLDSARWCVNIQFLAFDERCHR